MPPFQMPAEAIADEVKTFQEKLMGGVSNLLDMPEVRVGITPYEMVYQEDKVRLLHYYCDEASAQAEPRNPTPLVVVYALINRPYMLDLQEGRSTLRSLLDAGQDIYLVDWGYPEASDRYLTLDDYLNDYLDICIDKVRELTGVKQVNLLGICQGGTFSLCYSAMHPEKVKNLVTMVAPIDFHTPHSHLSHWVQNVDIDLVVDTLGNIPGSLLNWTFLNLKPYQLMGQKYLNMVDMMSDKTLLQNFMRMEKWIFDSPDQAGEAFRQFIKDFYQTNALIKNEIKIGDYHVDLNKITMPVLNVYAEQDHLVPPESSKALKQYVNTADYDELVFQGGHIGIYVSGKAQKMVAPAIGAWLSEHQ